MAWRIQELAEGEAAVGAMARVHERVALLGAELPERWRMRIAAQQKDPATGLQPGQGESKSIEPLEPLEPRDPRIPSVGSELTRIFKGTQYTVTVCREGFEHAGRHFKTLSAVAKHITGVPWNGFEFFRINSRGAALPVGGEA